MPIVLGAYDTGNMPLISGLTPLVSWIDLGNGVYQSSCTSYPISNYKIIIDGVQRAMGRYPNKGYLNFESHVGNSSIKDNELTAVPNWTNADVVIKKNRWIIDISKITAHSGNTISYTASSSDNPIDGFGYFIQNDPKTLDQFGEWYFDSAGRNMQVYFGSDLPGLHSVKISTVNELVNINAFDYVSFNDLSFQGAGVSAFQFTSAQSILIQRCNIDLSGSNAIVASGSPNLSIINTIINHSLNDAISADLGCTSTLIKNNSIKNTGLIEGMGGNGTGTYQAITSFGYNSLIELNEIDSTGYNGIYFGGNYSEVKNNLITNFCLKKDDGGGIYVGDWRPWIGKKITGNIILNGIGAGEGTDRPGYLPVEGIYIDDNTANAEIANNTVANCAEAGIKIHNAHEIQIKNNTLFNNGLQLLMAHDNIAASSPLRNITAQKNIMFSKSGTRLCLNIYSVVNDINSIGVLDSNYYCRPADENAVIQTTSNIWSSSAVTKNLSLSGWQANYTQDLHSKKTPVSLADTNNIRFEYNATGTPKTITLNGSYIGIDSVVYLNNVTLLPYTSLILLQQPVNSIQQVAVSAGSDTIIFLPTNTVLLKGRVLNSNSIITGYAWSKISGPVQCTISNSTDSVTDLTNLNAGVYKIEFKATNNLGAIGKDTITILVSSGVLPVNLVGFSAIKKNGVIFLNWETVSENGTDYYEIESSEDGQIFKTICKVNTKAGSGSNNYTFDDRSVLTGTIFYRLKIVNTNKSLQYSNVIAVFKSGASFFSIDQLKISSKTLLLSVSSKREQPLHILITDAMGRKLWATMMRLAKGNNTLFKNINYPGGGLVFAKFFTDDEIYTRPVFLQQ